VFLKKPKLWKKAARFGLAAGIGIATGCAPRQEALRRPFERQNIEQKKEKQERKIRQQQEPIKPVRYKEMLAKK